MIIVPNHIELPIDISELEVSSTRNALVKYRLIHNFHRYTTAFKRAKIPVAHKSQKSRYRYFGYNADLEYTEICVPTKATTESLDAFFKEQGERYCQAKLMKTLS